MAAGRALRGLSMLLSTHFDMWMDEIRPRVDIANIRWLPVTAVNQTVLSYPIE
jgi:hypothetical protein